MSLIFYQIRFRHFKSMLEARITKEEASDAEPSLFFVSISNDLNFNSSLGQKALFKRCKNSKQDFKNVPNLKINLLHFVVGSGSATLVVCSMKETPVICLQLVQHVVRLRTCPKTGLEEKKIGKQILCFYAYSLLYICTAYVNIPGGSNMLLNC